MHPVQAIRQKQEAAAIEKCRQDPKLVAMEASGKFCIVCMMSRPCLCDKEATVARMRTYYEAHRRRWLPWPRREPRLTGSWGRDMDALMTALYHIALGKEP